MEKINLARELKFGIGLVKDAGELLLEKISTDLNVKSKGVDGIVTDADISADKFIIKKIKKAFPDDGILTEESRDNTSRLNKKRVWIIDPLDGTANYKNYAQSEGTDKKSEFFGIHIGLAVAGSAVLGIVYIPIRKELFYAVKGEGAFKKLNDRAPAQLRVPDTKIKTPLIAFSGSIFRNPATRGLVKKTNGEIERFGYVFGYNIAAIADKQIHAYAAYSESATRTGEWDVCAPSVILTEAGGIINDFNGNSFKFNKEKPFCSNGVIAQARQGIISLNLL